MRNTLARTHIQTHTHNHTHTHTHTKVRNFAAECAANGASDALGLVFVLSASNLEHDYLGLHGVLESSEGDGPRARSAQPPAQSAVRQWVHTALDSSTWRGRWLAVLDDLPAPEAMQSAGVDWLLEEFPWTAGRTIITTRAAAWTDEEAMSVAFDAVDGGEEQRQCAECGQCPPALFKGTKCGKCKAVYYCCRACQQKAWRAHKPLCLRTVADKRSVADIVGLHVQLVGSFAEEEACSWIQSKVPWWRSYAEGILELVLHLECFPLAVALAAERARAGKTATPAEYLSALKHAGYKRATVRRTSEKHPECFPDVVKLLLDTILQSDQAHAEDAGQALRKLALLDTEAIPLDLLGTDERKAVVLLQKHSLVTLDDMGCAALHAVTQRVVRDWLTPKSHRQALVAALSAVLAAKLKRFDQVKPSTFFIGRRYARHTGIVAARAREWGVLPCLPGVDVGQVSRGSDTTVFDNIGSMCRQAGHFYEHVSTQPREALRMHLTTLDSFVTGQGRNHQWVAASYSDIGNVYRAQGKYDLALVQLQQSLKILIRAYGGDHGDVATMYNNIGELYQEQGNQEEAHVAFKQSLEIKIRLFGAHHPLTAFAHNNIGNLLRLQCRFAEALIQHVRALEIHKNVHGSNHPRTADSHNNLGLVWQQLGNYPNALQQHLKALDIRTKLLGHFHPDVGASYNNIGMAYDAQGDHEKALSYLEKSLDVCTQMFGYRHPQTADRYNNIGGVYRALGKYEEAFDFYQKSLVIKMQVFGQEHSLVADAKYNMGRVHENRDEMEMALALFIESHKMYLKAHGPSHKMTKSAADAVQKATVRVEHRQRETSKTQVVHQ